MYAACCRMLASITTASEQLKQTNKWQIAIIYWWQLSSVMARTLDLRLWGRWFNSRSGCYQVVTSRIFKVGSYLKCTMSASGRIWVEWVTVCRQVNHHSIQPTPRPTQPSSLRGRKIKYRHAQLGPGINGGSVHLCWVTGNTHCATPDGRWRSSPHSSEMSSYMIGLQCIHL